MTKYKDFLDDFTDQAYDQINKSYDLDSFEHAIKASISIDIVIFLIELLNSRGNKNTKALIDNLVSAITERCHPTAKCYIKDITSSREHAAAVLSNMYMGEDIKVAATATYAVKDLAPQLYNVRVQEYFSTEQSEPIMVISGMVNKLINNINGIDIGMELITGINEVFIQCATKLPRLIDSSSQKSSGNDNCYVVTAASGSQHSDLVVFYRKFRDEVLDKTKIVRNFIRLYYKKSPPLARLIEHNRLLKWGSLKLLKSMRYLINLARK
tara:strand:+ start:161 stop:964 length:804 start_codon:yes stop_codon:yes gene_type:complete